MTTNSELGCEEESSRPGWERLSTIFNTSDSFFENLLYLQGFELSSNIYVLAGASLAIIDPGNDYTAFMELWRLGFDPRQVSKVFLTHGHLDHAMGAIELLRSYPQAFANSALELLMHEAGPREIKETARAFGCRLTELRGGETIEVAGSNWQVIPTPGHTVDGICLYHPPSRTLATGDTVLPHAMAGPDKSAGGSLDLYLQSIRELLRRDIACLLPGHGTPVAPHARLVIEQTYESLMMKIIGVEEKTPWMSGAKALVEKGLLEEAIFCCDRELALDASSQRALQLKALCLNDLSRFADALAVLDIMKEVRPAVPDAFVWIGRGYALMGLTKYDESIAAFDQALRIDPGSRDARVYKGMALYLADRYDEAMEITEFRTEFMSRFKDELAKRRQPSA